MVLLAFKRLGCSDPAGNGTPAGAPASYDCEVRAHAWDFAKKTLPVRGSFKTAYDALQLENNCSSYVPAPPTEVDVYIPPHFDTPTKGAVIYADANKVATAGDDGTKARPFATLEAAINAAAINAAGTMAGGATVVLRKGTYHTQGVVLTTAHSGITIQNFEGEDAVVSGTVVVPSALNRWSLHNAAHNTWRSVLLHGGRSTRAARSQIIFLY